MVVDGNAVAWGPAPIFVGPPVPVRIAVDDGDSAEQEWEIEVTIDAAPEAPAILSPPPEPCVGVLRPTLRATAVLDPDGDAIAYHFQIDRDAGFRSIDLQGSGHVEAQGREMVF